MSELNADIPVQYCRLRAEYLYNGQRGHGTLIPCAVFGVTSLQGRAIGFTCMLENGAVIDRLPISAFVYKDDAPDIPLHYLELWDCLSAHVTVTEYVFLRGLRCDVVLKDRTWLAGIYMFTLDWHGSALADNPGEGGHKCAHVIALENGCFAAQPNNRIRWHEPSFVRPFTEKPDYETNDRVWSVENQGPKWITVDAAREQFYGIEEKR